MRSGIHLCCDITFYIGRITCSLSDTHGHRRVLTDWDRAETKWASPLWETQRVRELDAGQPQAEETEINDFQAAKVSRGRSSLPCVSSSSSSSPAVHSSPSVAIQLDTTVLPTRHTVLPLSGACSSLRATQDKALHPEPGVSLVLRCCRFQHWPDWIKWTFSVWTLGDFFSVDWKHLKAQVCDSPGPFFSCFVFESFGNCLWVFPCCFTWLEEGSCCEEFYAKSEVLSPNFSPGHWLRRRAGWTSLTFGSSPRLWFCSTTIKVNPSSTSVAPGFE